MAERSDPKTNGRRVVDDHASQSQLAHRGVGSKRKSSSGESGPSKRHRTSDSGAIEECQECKTIRTNLDNITRRISSDPSAGPTWFAQKLEEKAFISNAAGAVVTGLPRYEQVSKLIGAVKDKISTSQEPKREFAKFIEILQSNRLLVDLAKKLLQDYGVESKRKSSSGESGPSKRHRTSDSGDSHRKRSVLIPKTVLDMGDLPTLLELTRNARRQWVDIGLSLHFDKCELDEIQAHPQLIGDGVPGFFREMISRWLKRAPPNHGFPAISDLVSALQSAGEENVAYTLEHHYEGIPVPRLSLLSEGYSEEDAMESPRDKSNDDTVFSPGAESVEGIDHPRVYGCECGDCTFANVLERGCPQASVTMSGLPYLDTSGLDEGEKDDLIGKLLEDSRKMMFSFQKLVSRTCTSLEQRKVTPKQLVDCLIALGPLDPVLKGSEGGALHKGLSEMRKSGTVRDVFFQIRHYMSFFNYEILEHIVEELGTDDDRAEVVQYKGKLGDYCRRRAVECPLSYGMPSKSGHVRIVVKLDEEVEKYTVAELKLFQRNVSGILNLKEYALCLVSVNKGCLELTFQMPSFLKQKVFPLSYKQKEALKWEGVIKLQCEEYHFPSQEQMFDRKGEDDLGDGAGPSLTSNTTGGTPPPLPSQPPHQPHGRYAPPTAPPSKRAGYECIPVPRLSLLSEGYSEEDAMESPRDKSNDDTVFSPGAESVEGIDHPRVYGCECGDCTFANVLERGCPQASVTMSGLPYLDTSGLDESEKDYLIGKLLEDSRKMMYSFQKLVSRTCTSLEQRGVTPKELVDRLIALGPLDPVLKGSEGGALHKGLSEMRKSDTVGDVFFQIRDYMSFFNYKILEHIVEELGTDDDRAEVVQYKGKLGDYCRRRAFECPLSYGMPSKSGHVRIVVKLDEAVEKYTVAELEFFQRNVSGILNLKEYALCLVSVNKGCLELTFQMPDPSFLKQKVFPLSYKQEEALKWEGVIKLQCEEYHFPSQEQMFDRKGEDDLGDGAGPSLTSNTTGGTPPPLPSQPPHQPHGRYAPPTAPPSKRAGYECEFVDPPSKAFQTKCPICLNILCDPQETDCCGHNFCRTCIERVQEPSCPMCNTEQVTMHPNKGLKRSLNELPVRCTHKESGCNWVGELGEYDRHLNSIPRPSELLIGCEYNEIECEFSYAGCTTQIPRKDMTTHIDEAQPHHIGLLTQQINAKVKELQQSQEINTNLQEKNEELIMKSQRLENQVNQLKELTEKKDAEIEELRDSLQDKEKQLQVLSLQHKDTDPFPNGSSVVEKPPPWPEPAITKPPSYCLPAQPMQVNHCFTLDNFEDKKKKNLVCFSEPFFTHPQGYKVCVQIYPNGHGEGKDTHVTVSTCIMRGEYDDQLPWPFRGEFVIELLNQKADIDHCEKIIEYDDSVSKRNAGKITSSFHKRNSAFGFDRFVSHDTIYSQSDPTVQYLKDGCLKFRVREIQLNF